MLSLCQPALADSEKALDLKRDDVTAAKLRGFAEIGLNEWDKAVADFTTVIQKKPDDLLAYDRRAWAYRGLKNFDAATTDYSVLLEKNPNDAETLTKRGYTYALMQQYEKAVADFQAALKINPQDNDTFQRLQWAQGQLTAKNAPPSPSATAMATATPEKPSFLSQINPLYIIIAVVGLVVIAAIIRLITRGKVEPTSHRIR